MRWTLGARSGLARPGTLRLRAPLQKGQFTLRRVGERSLASGAPSSCGSRRAERARPPRRPARLRRARAAPRSRRGASCGLPASAPGRSGSPGSPRTSRRTVGPGCCWPPRCGGCRRSRRPAPRCSCAGRGCCRSRRSPASRSGSRSSSAARRRTCSCRSTRSIGALALGLALAARSAATCARASSARSRSRSPRSSPGPGSRCSGRDDLRQGAIFLLAFVASLRPARDRLRAAALEPDARCSRSTAALLATALAYAGDRALPVGDARRLLEPDA